MPVVCVRTKQGHLLNFHHELLGLTLRVNPEIWQMAGFHNQIFPSVLILTITDHIIMSQCVVLINKCNGM